MAERVMLAFIISLTENMARQSYISGKKNLEGTRPRRLEKKVRRRQRCGLGKRNKTKHQKASWDGKRKLIMIFLKVRRKVRS